MKEFKGTEERKAQLVRLWAGGGMFRGRQNSKKDGDAKRKSPQNVEEAGKIRGKIRHLKATFSS